MSFWKVMGSCWRYAQFQENELCWRVYRLKEFQFLYFLFIIHDNSFFPKRDRLYQTTL